jgi:hypothetical protein
MSFRETNTARQNLGNVVREQANTKGTGTPHIPTAVAERSKAFSFPALVNPDSDANRPKGNESEEPRGPAPSVNLHTSKTSMAAVENPDRRPNRK